MSSNSVTKVYGNRLLVRERVEKKTQTDKYKETDFGLILPNSDEEQTFNTKKVEVAMVSSDLKVDVNKGDRIVVAKYANTSIEIDDPEHKYFIVMGDDVLCKIEEDGE